MNSLKDTSRIIVTGGAGYIGGMVIDRLLEINPKISIISIDLLPPPKERRGNISWIQADLADYKWQDQAQKEGAVDAVVHCAFRIRNAFGKIKAYEKNNRGASENVFKFTFDNDIPSLVYLSTVSSYGAKKENIGRLLIEEDSFQEMKNPYGYQKKLIEEDLKKLTEEKKPKTKITILRLNSVTGPKGQSLSSKFGLITFLKKIFPFVIELNHHWARQFVHEDDVVEAIITSLTGNEKRLATYNIAPEKFLEVSEIAALLNKKTVKFPVWLVKIVLFVLWPISFGKLIPPGAVNGLVYPINVDGSAIKKDLGFSYKYTSSEALEGRVGRYKALETVM